MKGTYVIGVRGVEEDASFIISANNHPIKISKLIQSIPGIGHVPRQSAVYFYYYNIFDADVTINLTPI